FQTSPAEPGSWNSSFLFGLSVAALGMVFAGVETLTLQLSPYSRVGSGIAGAILAVSFIVRGFGDMSAVQGGALDWLSWLSPAGPGSGLPSFRVWLCVAVLVLVFAGVETLTRQLSP